MTAIILKTLMVFAATAVVDYIWAKYAEMMRDKRSYAAGGYAALIILMGGFVAITYISDPWYLIPAAAGAALGTWFAVHYQTA